MAADYERDYEVNKKRSLRSAKLSVTHPEPRFYFQHYRAPDITTDKARRKYVWRSGKGEARRMPASTARAFGAQAHVHVADAGGEAQQLKPRIPMLEENNARQRLLSHADFLKLVRRGLLII